MLAVLVGIEYKLAAIALILCSIPLVVQNGSMQSVNSPTQHHCGYTAIGAGQQARARSPPPRFMSSPCQ